MSRPGHQHSVQQPAINRSSGPCSPCPTGPTKFWGNSHTAWCMMMHWYPMDSSPFGQRNPLLSAERGPILYWGSAHVQGRGLVRTTGSNIRSGLNTVNEILRDFLPAWLSDQNANVGEIRMDEVKVCLIGPINHPIPLGHLNQGAPRLLQFFPLP